MLHCIHAKKNDQRCTHVHAGARRAQPATCRAPHINAGGLPHAAHPELPQHLAPGAVRHQQHKRHNREHRRVAAQGIMQHRDEGHGGGPARSQHQQACRRHKQSVSGEGSDVERVAEGAEGLAGGVEIGWGVMLRVDV